MFRWLTSGLLLRILSALLVVSVIPIYVIYTFTQQSYESTQAEVVTQSQKALDTKAIQGLEARSIVLANSAADFLDSRENDLHFLASQKPDAQTYLSFGSAQNSGLWTIKSDGQETQKNLMPGILTKLRFFTRLRQIQNNKKLIMSYMQ